MSSLSVRRPGSGVIHNSMITNLKDCVYLIIKIHRDVNVTILSILLIFCEHKWALEDKLRQKQMENNGP